MALIFNAKVRLFEALKANVPGDVQCTFAETGDNSRRKQVWLGATVDDDLAPVAMRSGAKPTNVTGYVEAHAVVTTPGNPVDAERAVYGIRDYVKAACAAVNADLVSVPGLMDVRPESASVESTETTDGAYSALTVRVRVRGRVYQ
ncbi:gp38 [Lomovskayavirus C31]|uniref:Gp38 n=1 Tax=Streptomyces phage phiC31 TaxID=10719 RepID=Q9ZXA9_BPPHC|nr:gp38 [Lomovskayavirus C31]CAA07108.1 gp38 [Lomovskayavirus C31]